MSVSIDGELHMGVVNVNYGEDFPKPNKSTRLWNDYYGLVLVYVYKVGIPKWTGKVSVKVPCKYYITQIIEPSEEYKRDTRIKRLGLSLVKG